MASQPREPLQPLMDAIVIALNPHAEAAADADSGTITWEVADHLGRGYLIFKVKVALMFDKSKYGGTR